jgi:hypothetical protein
MMLTMMQYMTIMLKQQQSIWPSLVKHIIDHNEDEEHNISSCYIMNTQTEINTATTKEKQQLQHIIRRKHIVNHDQHSMRIEMYATLRRANHCD